MGTPPVVADEAVRVVLVDDTPDIRLLLGLALDLDPGFTVVGEASDGIEALQVVAETRPDLVLLDLAMPRMDGLTVIPRIRQMCPDSTILVLSGFDGAVLGPRTVAAGADDYLRKGTSPQEIVSRVRALRGLRQDVPLPADPLSDAAASPPPADDAPPDPESTWSMPVDLLQSAPFGLITVRVGRRDDGDELWVSAANDLARAALDLSDGTLPARLSSVSPALDAMIRSGAPNAESLSVQDLLWPEEPLGRRDDLAVRLHRDGDVVTAVLMPVAAVSEAGRLRRAIASVVHELRNPITVLVGATQALTTARGRLAPDMEDRLFAAIDRQARHLERATSDLMTTVQRHSGTFDVNLAPMPLAPVLNRCVDSVTELGQVSVDCGDDVWVRADRDRLEQVVANLVSNAVKYGAPPISVAVTTTGDTLDIVISDGGTGVSPDFVASMFEEFTREARRGVPGTGLGLYVVRTLVEAHHGTISYSRTEDDRTNFTVSLPRVQPPRRRAADRHLHD